VVGEIQWTQIIEPCRNPWDHVYNAQFNKHIILLTDSILVDTGSTVRLAAGTASMRTFPISECW
jgi:hypothetical protein